MDLSIYYTEICEEPILTKKEEQDLMKVYRSTKSTPKQKKAAKDRIIRANLRFVFKQAKKYSKNDVEMFKELISAGNEGLLVGFEKFNPNRKIRFLSYAGWWVKQRILKEMSRMRIVALPIWKQQLATRIMRAKDNNEKIGIDDLIKMFPEVSEKDIRELYDTRYLTYYINDIEAESGTELESPEYDKDGTIDNRKIFQVVMSLPSPYREIVSMSYGIEDGEEMTISQMAKKLVLTKDQVKEFKKDAHEMLKKKLSTG
jgi:RNA polymerase sigma factor (sigma-70 family)